MMIDQIIHRHLRFSHGIVPLTADRRKTRVYIHSTHGVDEEGVLAPFSPSNIIAIDVVEI